LPQNVNFAVKSNYALIVADKINLPKASSGDKKFSEWVKLYRDSVRMVIAR
jgi:hypothetical protein